MLNAIEEDQAETLIADPARAEIAVSLEDQTVVAADGQVRRFEVEWGCVIKGTFYLSNLGQTRTAHHWDWRKRQGSGHGNP